jgi:hypothetical protein
MGSQQRRYRSRCRGFQRDDLVFTRPTDEAKPSQAIVAWVRGTRRERTAQWRACRDIPETENLGVTVRRQRARE